MKFHAVRARLCKGCATSFSATGRRLTGCRASSCGSSRQLVTPCSGDFDSAGEQLRARQNQIHLASQGLAIERLPALKRPGSNVFRSPKPVPYLVPCACEFPVRCHLNFLLAYAYFIFAPTHLHRFGLVLRLPSDARQHQCWGSKNNTRKPTICGDGCGR